MPRDALDALLAFIRADQFPRAGLPRLPDAPPPVVTIARDHGAGGEAIAARLAERLGVHCYDRELLDAVAAETTSDPALMRILDEKLPPGGGLFLYATLMGMNDPVSEHQKLLTRVVRAAAFRGAVLVGRGAHLLLRGSLRFRVRIVGSEDVCARRLAAPDADADRIAALRDEVRRTNAERAGYIRAAFDADINDPRQYDLTINTDRFTDLDEVAGLILAALKTHAAPVRE